MHRDIKLENVALADRIGSVAQLIDFGLTLRAGTRIEAVSGTISYLAPEICCPPTTAGFIVDPSSNVWSIGILLFCMLTGGYPWEQATLRVILTITNLFSGSVESPLCLLMNGGISLQICFHCSRRCLPWIQQRGVQSLKCTSTLTAHGSTSNIVHGTNDFQKPSDEMATSPPSGDITIQCKPI